MWLTEICLFRILDPLIYTLKIFKAISKKNLALLHLAFSDAKL